MGFLLGETCQRARVCQIAYLVFALLQRQDVGPHKFGGLCVLESEKQSALGTVDAVYCQEIEGNTFTECSVGTEYLRRAFVTHPTDNKCVSMPQLF